MSTLTNEHDDELREKLAAIEHGRWADQQRSVHQKSRRNADGTLTIPADVVARWERQVATPYAELSEPEKQADRDQVDRYWPLVNAERQHVAHIVVFAIDTLRNDLAETTRRVGVSEYVDIFVNQAIETIRKVMCICPKSDWATYVNTSFAESPQVNPLCGMHSSAVRAVEEGML